MSGYFHDMKYALAGVFVLMALGILAVSNLVMQPAVVQDTAEAAAQSVCAHIRVFNIFAPHFTEPFESMIILLSDGTAYRITTFEQRRINTTPGYVYEYLTRRGVCLGDIAIIIHNHLYVGGFSDADDNFYRYFYRRGFRGSFCIYYPFSGKVLVKEK